jgi:hypothetical protein
MKGNNTTGLPAVILVGGDSKEKALSADSERAFSFVGVAGLFYYIITL